MECINFNLLNLGKLREWKDGNERRINGEYEKRRKEGGVKWVHLHSVKWDRLRIEPGTGPA